MKEGEKSNVDIIKNLAKATNRKSFVEEKMYPVSGIRKFRKYQRKIYMPSNSSNSSYFIWYSDPYARIGIPTVFCGAFIPLPDKVRASFNIRKRSIPGVFNIFTKSEKIGARDFDSKVIIEGVLDHDATKMLSNTKIQHSLIGDLESENSPIISVNEFDIDFVPELSKKPYLGIVISQSWCFDKETINELLRRSEKIHNLLQL